MGAKVKGAYGAGQSLDDPTEALKLSPVVSYITR